MTKMKNVKNGDKFDDWTIDSKINHGGNGKVYRVINSSNREAAIKILNYREVKEISKICKKNKKCKTYIRNEKARTRFRDECQNMKKWTKEEIEGIMPILDDCFSKEVNPQYYWYVMPIAETLDKIFLQSEIANRQRKAEKVIDAILEISSALSILHNQGYSHRDIKPNNLFWGIQEGQVEKVANIIG